MGALYTKFGITTPEFFCLPVGLSLPFLLIIFVLVVSILLLYLWIVHTPCTYLMYYMFVYVSLVWWRGAVTPSTNKPILYCMLYLSNCVIITVP